LSVEQEVDSEGYVKLVAVEEVPPGEMVQVTLDWQGEEQEIALANAEGQIYAFKDICPHMNYPLSIGLLHGSKLECRGHSWRFDLVSGRTLSPPIRKTLNKYPIKLIDGIIWARLD